MIEKLYSGNFRNFHFRRCQSRWWLVLPAGDLARFSWSQFSSHNCTTVHWKSHFWEGFAQDETTNPHVFWNNQLGFCSNGKIWQRCKIFSSNLKKLVEVPHCIDESLKNTCNLPHTCLEIAFLLSSSYFRISPFSCPYSKLAPACLGINFLWVIHDLNTEHRIRQFYTKFTPKLTEFEPNFCWEKIMGQIFFSSTFVKCILTTDSFIPNSSHNTNWDGFLKMVQN